MKNLLYLNSTIVIFTFNVIFAPCLKAQDTINFYSDTSVICNNVAEPNISCIFKPGPGNLGYEWTFPNYITGADWGAPLTEPTIGTWWMTPVDLPGVHWIWPRNSDGLSCEHAFFRKVFSIPDHSIVESCTLEISSDNEYIAYFNGVEIGNDGDCEEPYEGDIWVTSEIYEIDPDLFFLSEKENVLALHTYDNYLIAGLRFHLQIQLSRRPLGGNDYEIEHAPDFINIYPNPFSEMLTIQYPFSDPKFQNIEIYNSTGLKIESIINNIQTADIHSYHWNTTELSPGIYIIKLQTQNESKTIKIIKSY